MPRNAAGVYSLPAGNPVVTATVISSVWANTTLSDIGTAMTGSLARNGDGGMTGQFKADDGAIGAPGISWASETTTGWYRASAGNIRFAIAGADIITVTAAGIVVSAMTVSGILSAGGFNATGAVAPANGFYLPGASTVTFTTNTVTRLTLGSTGTVTVAPVASGVQNLIVGDTTDNVYSTFSGNLRIGKGTLIAANVSEFYNVGAFDFWIGNSAAQALNFFTANVARASISGAGNVVVAAVASGITVTVGSGGAASISLHVNALTGGIVQRWNDGTVNADFTMSGTQANIGTTTNHPFTIYTNAVVRVNVAVTGHTTITAAGSAVPLGLTVTNNGAGAGTLTRISLNDGTGNLGYLQGDPNGNAVSLRATDRNDRLDFWTGTGGGAQRVTINQLGNVGINAPTSGIALSILGDTETLSITGANSYIGFHPTATGHAFAIQAQNSVDGWRVYDLTDSRQVLTISNAGVGAINDAGTMREIGYRDLPPILYGSGGTLALTSVHNGKAVIMTAGTAVPAIVAADGYVVTFIVGVASTFTNGATTLYWSAGSGSFPTGTRNAAVGSVVTMYAYGGAMYIWGNGLT